MNVLRLPSLLLLLLGMIAAAPAGAQSLLAARGLGLITEPLDGRARGLGGVGLGLPGFSLSLVNPAGVAGVPAPALLIAFQPELYSSELRGEQIEGSAARFPLIHAAFPVGERWTASVGYGSFLDQNWGVELADTLQLSDRRVPIVDRFASRGGVGRFRVGGAYKVWERLSVGVAADIFTGAAYDTLSRVFGRDSVTGDQIAPSIYGADWTYSGVGAAVGAHWTPMPALNLAAAVSGGGDLRARPEGSDSIGSGRTYALPVHVHLGASGQVASGTLLALAADWSGWSSIDGAVAGSGGSRNAWSLAGGAEWAEPGAEGRSTFPLRLGARYAALPFRWGDAEEAGEFPTERALTAGAGARVAGGAALADLALERGWRGGEDAFLKESYWRLTVSISLLGR